MCGLSWGHEAEDIIPLRGKAGLLETWRDSGASYRGSWHLTGNREVTGPAAAGRSEPAVRDPAAGGTKRRMPLLAATRCPQRAR